MLAARGGVPYVVPAVELRPRGASAETAAFAHALMQGELSAVIFLTGVGARLLAAAVEDTLPPAALASALGRTVVIARGPKPLAALRELGIPAIRQVARPHTWRQILEVVDAEKPPLRARRVAVQEYGEPPAELLDALRQRDAEVLRVPVYEWRLPTDVHALREALDATMRGDVAALLFTAAIQVNHVFQVAAAYDLVEPLRRAAASICVASIGPTTTEALRAHGLAPDVEATRPNMGLLVEETAACLSTR
jgi:uroporphyrinogen-III synthase